ncbi:hypothetical protein ACLB2K_061605 [Fragaria x ananassa]
MRDAGSADNGAVAISEPYAGVIEQGEDEMDEIIKSNFDETERAVDKTSTDANVGLGIPTSTMEGGFPKGSEKSEEKIHVTDANAVSEDWESVSESKNADNNFGVERQIGEIRIVNNILEAEKSISETSVDLRVVITVVEETHVPVANKEEVLQAERAENNISHVTFPSINEKENVVSANADARKIADESGLYVFDENNASAVFDQYFTGGQKTTTTNTTNTSSSGGGGGGGSTQSAKKQQLAAISDWFVADKKHSYKQRSKSDHVRSKKSSFSSHVTDEDRELLLPPEAVVDVLSAVPDTMSFKVDWSVDQDFDRQVSLPRLSSGSSYAGSLFSGTTTLDGNFSGDIKESSATTRPAEEEVEEES